ncbi:NIPSNAP family protein [Limisphaera sp. 4302-co]|uniref:NIPSNAP family protein n=1 Tax=Limisphaera sp. 4302-co TaxID=3400417 RepID=UPI003C207D58
MQRREFLQSLGLAGLGLSLGTLRTAAAEAAGQEDRQIYELRRYELRRGPMVRRLDDFLAEAALPAWNRAGVRPVGVFDAAVGPENPTRYVLLPCRSLAHWLEARQVEASDAKILSHPFTQAPPGDPPYVRYESSLMIAFAGMPALEPPPQTAAGKPRLFELRIYESHSDRAHRKKVEMFNVGEIALFKRTGLRPVFFGSTLIGARLPNLTYMLVFDDLNARETAWRTFVGDPEWKKLSTTPGYTDAEIVTNITNHLLRPVSSSQI